MMRDRERVAPEEWIEGEKERRQVAAVCQEDTKQQFATKGHCKDSKNKDDVDSFQYYNDGFKEALKFYDASEDVTDEGEEILRVEKFIRSEDENERDSRQQSSAKVSSNESVDFDHRDGTKCVYMLDNAEKRRKEFTNLIWDHGYRIPHWKMKPIGERQQLKCRDMGGYVGFFGSNQNHKRKGMIKFKG